MIHERLPFGDVRVCWRPQSRWSFDLVDLRLPALLFLVLLLFGCGTADRGGYADRPPTNRTALVAWEEWTRFGRSTVVYGGAAGGYTNRAGVSERSEPLSSRVGDYWGSCGHPEWNGHTSSRPWSGAFVSWVMKHSGAGGFPAAGRHGQYLSALYDREHGSRSTAFLLHAPNEYSPKPGDLVCSGTAGASWRYASPAMAHRRIDSTASHCDVVTDVRGGYVQAVGGNVKNSVTMSLYPIDSRGRLAPTPGKLWMMVVENRAT
ncbi:hypothetical protein SAMN02745126_04176 [Enhydrobacter aerosaccus]|uniref:DUF2272 domain-containing protein n=1 Tax=Enhydrobacter aerosaccus TaxID=225324 RepID=A0A1T4RYG1_9HYPH|nr:hypothetical protein SAMN02745126_04176 [Enhydrobacter aerosaccus]